MQSTTRDTSFFGFWQGHEDEANVDSSEAEGGMKAGSDIRQAGFGYGTLSFSDEEWAGLATWQRELYVTVIKDVMELFSSLDCLNGVLVSQPVRQGVNALGPLTEEGASQDKTESLVIQDSEKKPFHHSARNPDQFVDVFAKTPITVQESPIPESAGDAFVMESESSPSCGIIMGSCFAQPAQVSVPPGCDVCSVLRPETDFIRIINVEEIDINCKLGENESFLDCVQPPTHNEELRGVEACSLTFMESTVRPVSRLLWLAEGKLLVQDLERKRDSAAATSEEGAWWVTPEYNGTLAEISAPKQTFNVATSRERSFSPTCDSPCPCKMLLVGDEKNQAENGGTLSSNDRLQLFSHKGNILSHQHVARAQCHEEGTKSSWRSHPAEAEVHSKSNEHFVCAECGRSFSQRFTLSRHQKIHTRDRISPKLVAPLPRKVHRLPAAAPAEDVKAKEVSEPPGDYCSKLHHHLHLSTVFLQNLMTSTSCFEYD